MGSWQPPGAQLKTASFRQEFNCVSRQKGQQKSEPARLVTFGHPAIALEDQKTIERLEKPAVVRGRDDGALIVRESELERVGRGDVQVVGRLIQGEHGGSVDLEEQDLQSRLLAAGQFFEGHLKGLIELVTPQRPQRFGPVESPPLQDVERPAARKAGRVVDLREVANLYPGAQHAVPGVLHGLTGQEPQKMALAGSIPTKDGQALAKQDLRAEGLDESRKPEALEAERDGARPASFETNGDPLVGRGLAAASARRSGPAGSRSPGLGRRTWARWRPAA